MAYPYIGKTESGSVVLFHKESTGRIINHVDNLPRGRVDDDWVENEFKNITAEYLANTYGEVKSKEHAEFIVKLAEVNGLPCAHKEVNESCKFFYIIDGALFFCPEKINAVGQYKQITIPLPPECDSVDEWPVVGDKVQTSIGEGEVKLMPDGRGLYIACVDGDYYAFSIEQLSKPKTPEQELRDELTVVMQRNLTYDQIVTDLIDKYDIKKKPQKGAFFCSD